MKIIAIPTFAAYLKYVAPLRQMGYTDACFARLDGVLTDREYRFMVACGLDTLPSIGEFNAMTNYRFNAIRQTF